MKNIETLFRDTWINNYRKPIYKKLLPKKKNSYNKNSNN